MSYQLPDLLTLINSLNHDAELHINIAYQSVSDASLRWLLANLSRTNRSQGTKTLRLQKTLHEFLGEYNPGLLASTYLPFVPVAKNPTAPPSILQVATEWLGLCAVVSEEILRPHRIVDYEFPPSTLDAGASQRGHHGLDSLLVSVWKSIVPHLNPFCSSDNKDLQNTIDTFLDAYRHPPSRPVLENISADVTTEYLRWRVALGGYQVLAGLILPPRSFSRFQSLLVVTTEIIACVMDLFAYNVHQAWQQESSGDHSHLNLVAFILAGDPELTLQGAVNVVEEMIQDRLTRLREELPTPQQSLETSVRPKETGGIFGSILASLLSNYNTSLDEGSSHGSITTGDDIRDSAREVRKLLLSWLTGTIHWAYQVEYFFPDTSDETGEVRRGKPSGNRRSRGSEVRDYGWVFLIKGEEVDEHRNP